jgi:hypothetical protein
VLYARATMGSATRENSKGAQAYGVGKCKSHFQVPLIQTAGFRLTAESTPHGHRRGAGMIGLESCRTMY